MPWGRTRLGNVLDGGLVHIVYTEHKEDRIYWTSQCDIRWSHRENRDRSYQPKVTKRRVTCVRCMYLHLKNGWPW